jgi:hypothetical protein
MVISGKPSFRKAIFGDVVRKYTSKNIGVSELLLMVFTTTGKNYTIKYSCRTIMRKTISSYSIAPKNECKSSKPFFLLNNVRFFSKLYTLTV